MFSELAHYPKGFQRDSRIKREPKNLPLDAAEHERLRREAAERTVVQPMEDMVSGANRHKFVRAPLASSNSSSSSSSLSNNNKNTTKIQQQIFNMNAHLFFAFTSASAEISSWQAAV